MPRSMIVFEHRSSTKRVVRETLDRARWLVQLLALFALPTLSIGADVPAGTTDQGRGKTSQDDEKSAVEAVIASPEDPERWNRLRQIALQRDQRFCDFDVRILADRGVRDDKPAVVVSEAIAESGLPKPVREFWITYAILRIILLDPDQREKRGYDKDKFPLRDPLDAFDVALEEWRKARAADPSLHDSTLDRLAAVKDAGTLPAYVYLHFFRPGRRRELAVWATQNAASLETYFTSFVFGCAEEAR